MPDNAPRERCSRPVLPPPMGHSLRHRTEQLISQLPSATTDHSARVRSRWAPRVYDRWRDVGGTHVTVGTRVEQAETDARMGALRSRLYRRGQVIGRGTTRLVVRFDDEDQTVSIRPHLVRVVEGDGHRGG
jgi:hypothetical protein